MTQENKKATLNDEQLKALLASFLRVKQSDGYLKFKEILHLRSSFLVFLDNHKELIKLVNLYKKDYDILADKISLRWRTQRKLLRAYYNFISSAQSLLEHLRAKSEERLPHIPDKFLRCFFKELRHMIMHESNFFLISIRSWRSGDGSRTYQATEKAQFVNFLENKLTTLKTDKMIRDISFLIQELSTLPRHIELDNLLSQYYNAILDSRGAWVIRSVKSEYTSLMELHTVLKTVDLNRPGSPINLVQNRYLGYLLSKSIAKRK